MGKEGQRKSHVKRVRFGMTNMEASTPTVGHFSLAKSRDRGSQEPAPMSRPTEQHTRREIRPASGKVQDVHLKREDRSDATRMPGANGIKIQIYRSNVDSVVVEITSCCLEPASTTVVKPMATHGLGLCLLV